MASQAYARRMSTSRIAGAAAAGIAAILALSGCIQLPSPVQPQSPTTGQPQSPTTQPQDPSSEPTAGEGDALVDTRWTGTVTGPELSIDLEFTFEEDGTLYISRWNDETGVPFDVASDTWSVASGTLSMTLSDIQEIQRIDLTGPLAEGTTLSLTGADGVGTAGYSVTFTQAG